MCETPIISNRGEVSYAALQYASEAPGINIIKLLVEVEVVAHIKGDGGLPSNHRRIEIDDIPSTQIMLDRQSKSECVNLASTCKHAGAPRTAATPKGPITEENTSSATGLYGTEVDHSSNARVPLDRLPAEPLLRIGLMHAESRLKTEIHGSDMNSDLAVLVVFEVLSVAAFPSSSHPHEPTDIANTFPRAPFFLTLPLINTSQAGEHFAYFKNSPLSDPISCSATASGRNGSKITSHAQVKSQTKFCSHLVPGSQYALLPTSVTPAAFFPTWSSILITIFVGIVKYISSVSLVNEGSLKKVGVANFVHDIGLVVAWWCGTIISLRNPHHAVWQNVMTWILVMPYSFLFFPLVIFPLAQMAAIGYSVYVRFSKVGAIAYTLMPSFSVESLSPTAECLALITNPLSDLYVDALYDQNRALQALEFSLSLLALIPFVFMFIPGCANGENDAKIMFLTIAWLAMLAELLIPLIWLGVLAGRGTPITWSHECGVVVIGMSPRLGYWDVKVPDTLQTVQVVRAIFGL